MSTIPAPNGQRLPQLSEHDLHQALAELDIKIKTLHNRVHATVAGSPNTYQAHAEALETKHARLAEQLIQSPAPADGSEPGVWAQVRQEIEHLKEDLRKIL